MSDYRNDHPLEEDLHAYLDGELAASQTGALAEHLEECASCRLRLSGIEALFFEIESLADERLDTSYSHVITARLDAERRAHRSWGWVLLAQFAAAGLLAWFARPTILRQWEQWLGEFGSWIGQLSLQPELRSLIGTIENLLAGISRGVLGVFELRLPAMVTPTPVLGWCALLALGVVLWLSLNRWLLGASSDMTPVDGRRG